MRLTWAETLVGTATFGRLHGIAITTLEPAPAYAGFAEAAQDIGDWLVTRRHYAPNVSDFTEAVFERWSGPQLNIEDEHHTVISTGLVILADTTRVFAEKGAVWTIADFRTDSAGVEAFLRTIGRGDGDWKSPQLP